MVMDVSRLAVSADNSEVRLLRPPIDLNKYMRVRQASDSTADKSWICVDGGIIRVQCHIS